MSLDTRAGRAEINRLNRLISDEQQTINALFQRIGQTYFIAHKEDPEDSQAAYIRSIFDAIDRTKQYKEQINRVRGIAICPNCSAEVTITSAFCNRCGSRMPNAAAFGGAPGYGAQTAAAPGFGGPQYGGAPFGSAPAAAPAYPPAAGAPAHSPEPEVGEISCPSCGAACSSSQRFCNRCGGTLVPVAVDEASFSPFDSAPQTSEPGKKVCPNCGTELAEDSAFCLECGQPV